MSFLDWLRLNLMIFWVILGQTMLTLSPATCDWFTFKFLTTFIRIFSWLLTSWALINDCPTWRFHSRFHLNEHWFSYLAIFCSKALANCWQIHVECWMVNVSCEFRRISSVPNELVVVQESCVFDQTEALLHSVDKGLDFQVGHLIQWEEADAPKNIQQVARLQVERLQILQTTRETHTHKKWQDTREGQEQGLSLPVYQCLLTKQ